MILLMADILHQVVGTLSHYLQGFLHPRWLFGISSINSIGIEHSWPSQLLQSKLPPPQPEIMGRLLATIVPYLGWYGGIETLPQMCWFLRPLYLGRTCCFAWLQGPQHDFMVQDVVLYRALLASKKRMGDTKNWHTFQPSMKHKCRQSLGKTSLLYRSIVHLNDFSLAV